MLRSGLQQLRAVAARKLSLHATNTPTYTQTYDVRSGEPVCVVWSLFRRFVSVFVLGLCTFCAQPGAHEGFVLHGGGLKALRFGLCTVCAPTGCS